MSHIIRLLIDIRKDEIMERTLVLLKPDAIEKKLMGEIISIYEKKGLHISSLKIIKPSTEIAKKHYYEHKDKPFFKNLVSFITRGEVCALIIEGNNVINIVRKINGATDPFEADMGTIRGQFGISKSENIVHSSDSMESAEREIKIWFPEI
jgi:nucleoside-diphosphate kinase